MISIILLIIAVLLIVYALKKKERYKFKVAGLSHYCENYRGVIDPEGRLTVDLIPEPDNPHDPNAIRVYMNGKHIGYVPKEKTAKVRKFLSKIYEISAEVELDGDFWEDVEIFIWYKK